MAGLEERLAALQRQLEARVAREAEQERQLARLEAAMALGPDIGDGAVYEGGEAR